MWKFITDNWLVDALGLVIACIASRFVYKHPRFRAFIQPAKELQTLISERNELLKQCERLVAERNKAEAFKEGLLDEIEVLRTVRDDMRIRLDAAKAEAVRMQHYIQGGTALLDNLEIKKQ